MAKEMDSVDVGNASPPVGKAYKGSEKSGEKGYGKESWSRPSEQAVSERPYKGGQSAGVKGHAQDPMARKF
jgi:hypothetical protein